MYISFRMKDPTKYDRFYPRYTQVSFQETEQIATKSNQSSECQLEKQFLMTLYRSACFDNLVQVQALFPRGWKAELFKVLFRDKGGF